MAWRKLPFAFDIQWHADDDGAGARLWLTHLVIARVHGRHGGWIAEILLDAVADDVSPRAFATEMQGRRWAAQWARRHACMIRWLADRADGSHASAHAAQAHASISPPGMPRRARLATGVALAQDGRHLPLVPSLGSPCDGQRPGFASISERREHHAGWHHYRDERDASVHSSVNHRVSA